MVDAGAARCAMGNHEFNAIAWATADPDHPGEFFRPHGKPGNREQHQAFLSEVQGTSRHAEIIEWFKTLPLWIDLKAVRIVHACWHLPSMDYLAPLMEPDHTLTDELVMLGSRQSHPAYAAVEIICKGPEVKLPEGISFRDKEGKARYQVRVRWWQDDLSTYQKAAIGPRDEIAKIPNDPLPPEWRNHPYHGPPVLFGHYWFTGKPAVISQRFACLDYSAAREGPLVAYRWDGEPELSSTKLVWI